MHQLLRQLQYSGSEQKVSHDRRAPLIASMIECERHFQALSELKEEYSAYPDHHTTLRHLVSDLALGTPLSTSGNAKCVQGQQEHARKDSTKSPLTPRRQKCFIDSFHSSNTQVQQATLRVILKSGMILKLWKRRAEHQGSDRFRGQADFQSRLYPDVNEKIGIFLKENDKNRVLTSCSIRKETKYMKRNLIILKIFRNPSLSSIAAYMSPSMLIDLAASVMDLSTLGESNTGDNDASYERNALVHRSLDADTLSSRTAGKTLLDWVKKNASLKSKLSLTFGCQSEKNSASDIYNGQNVARNKDKNTNPVHDTNRSRPLQRMDSHLSGTPHILSSLRPCEQPFATTEDTVHLSPTVQHTSSNWLSRSNISNEGSTVLKAVPSGHLYPSAGISSEENMGRKRRADKDLDVGRNVTSFRHEGRVRSISPSRAAQIIERERQAQGEEQGGGFISAAEQLMINHANKGNAARGVNDNGKSNSLLSNRRCPALGLRRSGFNAPFKQHQGKQEDPNREDKSSFEKNGKSEDIGRSETPTEAKKPNKLPAQNESDDNASSFPPSLLLPDGSVPDELKPLDPQLVTQITQEVLEQGAGAKNIGWDDIAGLEYAKKSIEEAIVWPLARPDLFVGLRNPPRGLLLFGPPGTGKTMIARAIANRSNCTFFNISSSSLMSKWMGDGEKLVRCLFAVAVVKQPSVIFIDEIDSLLSARGEGETDAVRRVKTELLVHLDGVGTSQSNRVLLIGATNRPDELDEAARRRMENRLYIPLPDLKARQELIFRLLQSVDKSLNVDCSPNSDERGGNSLKENQMVSDKRSSCITQEEILSVAKSTDGYSGADLKHVCREAAMRPLRELTVRELSEVNAQDLRAIEVNDLRQALKRIKPSVGAEEVERYIKWNASFGSFSNNEQDDNSQS